MDTHSYTQTDGYRKYTKADEQTQIDTQKCRKMDIEVDTQMDRHVNWHILRWIDT